jgi:transcription elongation factor GreA
MRRKYSLTQTGFETLKKEYDDLSARRLSAVQELTTARDMGDRSENAAYKSARWKLSGIDRRLRYLKIVLSNAHILAPPSDGTIGIGSQVTLIHNNKEVAYTLVSSTESDILQGLLSASSPLGRMLMGKRMNDTVTIQAPHGSAVYTIINVVN